MAAQVGNRGVFAKALEDIGYGYLCTGDCGNAYEAYGAAGVEYSYTFDGFLVRNSFVM